MRVGKWSYFGSFKRNGRLTKNFANIYACHSPILNALPHKKQKFNLLPATNICHYELNKWVFFFFCRNPSRHLIRAKIASALSRGCSAPLNELASVRMIGQYYGHHRKPFASIIQLHLLCLTLAFTSEDELSSPLIAPCESRNGILLIE